MAGGRLIPGSQYGEDAIIVSLFGGMRGGVALDVGAADGYHHSNVHRLITEYEWSAVLVEPHPILAVECAQRYAERKTVHVVQEAVRVARGTCILHLYEPSYYGQVSTIRDDFRLQVIEQHGDQYTKDVEVQCAPVSEVLARFPLASLNFVNIDCEGSEIEALQSFPWVQRPELFVVEMAMDVPMIEAAFAGKGYRQLAGLQRYRNAFFVPEERYAESQRLALE